VPPNFDHRFNNHIEAVEKQSEAAVEDHPRSHHRAALLAILHVA
jgi:hypothetical protein